MGDGHLESVSDRALVISGSARLLRAVCPGDPGALTCLGVVDSIEGLRVLLPGLQSRGGSTSGAAGRWNTDVLGHGLAVGLGECPAVGI